jgi:hypothetical protein
VRNNACLLQFGDDEFGHMLVNILKQNGVDAEGCLYDEHARTALAFVTLKTSGEREFMFYRNPSADMLLTEAELNLGLIRRAKVFHYGSISLIAEPCRSAHLAAMRAAKAAGILCSYDPNVRLPLWPSEDAARDGIRSIWNEADFIKVSDDEVAFLTKGDAADEKNVLSLWFDGLKLLVVTDGDKGCRYFTKVRREYLIASLFPLFFYFWPPIINQTTTVINSSVHLVARTSRAACLGTRSTPLTPPAPVTPSSAPSSSTSPRTTPSSTTRTSSVRRSSSPTHAVPSAPPRREPSRLCPPSPTPRPSSTAPTRTRRRLAPHRRRVSIRRFLAAVFFSGGFFLLA